MLLRKRKYTKRQRRTMWPGNSARFSEEGIELPSADREGRGQRKVDKIIPEAQERERRQELRVSWGEKSTPERSPNPQGENCL